ncbi:sodium:solute symporter [Aminipila butyrica]|uniref:Sodium:solute symporter n=1 Tax=Aminipila butyrica TaxID=433296 RepID=A0A858BSM8_9FIRM|nr:sodium:solute symporter [Aminipila butyrica]QIB68903.1 sodium:solute symporter [Aminipila butyrica]
MLSTFDFVIIGFYFLAMILIGFISMKFAKSKEDFLVAGRRLSFPLFFGCMSAMALGGAATVGGAKLGYLYGFGGIWVGVSIGLGLILTGLLVSSKLSKLRALSINEVVEANYGSTARVFSSTLTFIYTITLSVVQVIAIGTIISASLNVDATMAMIVGGGIVIIYTFIGGMWSVTLTDIVQFVIKTVGLMILAPIFAISAVGGWDNLIHSVPESYLTISSMGWASNFKWIILYVPGLVIGQDIWQRIFTAKNNRIATSGTILAGVYSILYAVAIAIVGMSVFVLLPDLADPQTAFTEGVMVFLPSGVKGIVLAAAVAATMSVSSGTILASSTILYNDLYQRFINPNPDEKKAIWITRAFALLIGVVVMICALWINDVLAGIDICYGYLSGCVFVPLLASFVLKRFSPKAGLYSLAVSAVVVTVLFFKFGILSLYPILYGMLSGLIVYVVVNLVSKEKVESTFAKVEADLEEQQGA